MKELKFPVEIFPTKEKVLQIKEGVYWVKLLLPSMISHVNAYILDDEEFLSKINQDTSKNSLILMDENKVYENYLENDYNLKYFNEEPVIKELVRESRPGLRKYLSYKDVKPYKGGLGLKVLTTSKGLMTDKDAIKKQLGGEVICRVF